MPANAKPRWITFHKVPYNHPHSRSAVVCYSETGEFLVPARVADRAVAKGYATEGKAPDSTTRSVKGGPKRPTTRRPKRAKPLGDAKTADRGSNPKLVRTDRADHARPGVRIAVDPAAG